MLIPDEQRDLIADVDHRDWGVASPQDFVRLWLYCRHVAFVHRSHQLIREYAGDDTIQGRVYLRATIHTDCPSEVDFKATERRTRDINAYYRKHKTSSGSL